MKISLFNFIKQENQLINKNNKFMVGEMGKYLTIYGEINTIRELILGNDHRLCKVNKLYQNMNIRILSCLF
jgi:hypothetical protein